MLILIVHGTRTGSGSFASEHVDGKHNISEANRNDQMLQPSVQVIQFDGAVSGVLGCVGSKNDPTCNFLLLYQIFIESFFSSEKNGGL
jgi:hypothetical protein